MEFTAFKMEIIEATGLAKDALHIYVGLSIYLISLLLSRPVFKAQSTRQIIALIMATSAAIVGEVLDVRYNISRDIGLRLGASIHDILNTCFWPYMLFAITRWTKLFHPTSQPKSVVRRHKKTDY